MATLYITEFVAQGRDGAGYVAPAPLVPPVAEQTVAIGGTSTASSAFNARTAVVRILSDSICSIAWGTAPTATTTTARVPADVPMDFMVPVGQSFKVAVITNT